MQEGWRYGQNFEDDIKMTEAWEILHWPTESTISAYYKHAICLATTKDKKGSSKKYKQESQKKRKLLQNEVIKKGSQRRWHLS